MKPENIRRWDHASSCSVGALAITIFEGAPTAKDALEALRVLADVAAVHPQLMILTVIASHHKLPDTAVRDLMTREVKRVKKQISCVATVVEGSGFGAAAIRSAATAMTIMIRPEYPVKTFASVVEAAVYLAKQGALRADAITAAIAQMRAPPS